MDNTRYFTAGEFAKAAGTTKDTLIHYEEIGLFTPACRGDNNYRYYSIEQLDTFDAISILRELDMPLSDIRYYLEHKSPDAFLSLLRQEEEHVRRKQERLARTGKWLREKAEQVAKGLHIVPGTVRKEELPEQYMVCGYSSFSGNMEVALGIGRLYEKCEKYGCKSAYNIGFIQREESLRQGIYDNYHEYYMLFDELPEKIAFRRRAAGYYLCAYHKGHWNRIQEAYTRLFDAAEADSLALDGEFYEDYMLDELTVSGQENYVTRIAVKFH